MGPQDCWCKFFMLHLFSINHFKCKSTLQKNGCYVSRHSDIFFLNLFIFYYCYDGVMDFAELSWRIFLPALLCSWSWLPRVNLLSTLLHIPFSTFPPAPITALHRTPISQARCCYIGCKRAYCLFFGIHKRIVSQHEGNFRTPWSWCNFFICKSIAITDAPGKYSMVIIERKEDGEKGQ